ncbi:MAG: hypothetical protein QG671_127 [Actinomycetota bacterium]|nr:hypothetical protein [Actinomycetota bacterium]
MTRSSPRPLSSRPSVPRPAPTPRPLIGRSAEIEALTGWLAEAATGHGGVVLVEGEPGIGKSALLADCAQRARLLGYSVFAGTADEVAGQFPLWVVLGMLGSHAETGAPGSTSLVQDLAEGVPTSAVVDRAVDVVQGLCDRAPVVLVLDDLQLVDEAGLLLWQRLAAIADRLPLLLLAACRRAPARDGIERIRRGRAGRVAVLDLGALSVEDGAALVLTLSGTAKGLPPGRIEDAAGNPRYLTLLASAPPDAAGAVHRQVLESLAFLPSRTVQGLRTAALLGRDFSLSDLASASGRSVFQLAYEAQEAMALRLLVESGDRLAFRHALVHESLYLSVPAAVRVGLHRHTAHVLDRAQAPVTEVAPHLIRSPVDGWALDWVQEHAAMLCGYSPQLAVELLRHVLDHVADRSGRRPGLTAYLTAALCDRGDDAETESWARKLAGGGCDPELSLPGNRLLATVLARTGRVALAVELAARVARGLEHVDEPAMVGERVRLLALVARYGVGGDAPCDGGEADGRVGCAWAAPRALALTRCRCDLRERAEALRGAAAVQRARGRAVAALKCLDRAVAEVRNDPGQGAVQAVLLHDRVELLRALHRTARIEEDLVCLGELALRGIDPARAHLARATHRFRLGRWDEAKAELRKVTAEQVPVLRAQGVAAIIEIRHSSRRAVLSQDKQSAGAAVGGVYCLLARSAIAEWSGHRDQALSILETLLEPRWDPFEPRLEFLPTLARLAINSQRPDLAEGAAAVAARIAATDPTPEARSAADHCLGLVEECPAAVLRAVERYRPAGMRLHLARALEDVAVLSARAGQTDQARQAHREVAELYTAMEAVRDLQRVDARLRSFGVRRGSRAPRCRPDHGWAALSPAEVTVAKLVAEGLSNPEIAKELVLSPRTVQSHVSHILAKLGGRSRAEIAREVERNRG